MPGDLRSEEFGPYPYHYEGRFNHHPESDSNNQGCADQWKKEDTNEQVSRIFQNMRKKYLDTDLNLI